MWIKLRFARTSRVVWAAILFCVLAGSALGRLVAARDPLEGILDAKLVVIVELAPLGNSESFRVTDVLLGDARPGDLISLPGFKLATEKQYGPDEIDTITPETRILLMLQHPKGSRTTWEPTYYKHSYFWVQRADQVAKLRSMAQHAIELRKQWEEASELPDPRQRVASLWPYLALRTYRASFFEHTKAELRKAKPESGRYFAEQFDKMTAIDRGLLITDAGEYGSEELHEKVKQHIDKEQRKYEVFITTQGWDPKHVNSSSLPADVSNASGEIYYALAGLAGFRDRNDLPYIREKALWAAKFHKGQIATAALNAFREMPAKDNLATIEVVSKELRWKGTLMNEDVVDYVDIERSLCAHHYREAVPQLVPFLSDDFIGVEAEDCLAKIAGRDLGPRPKAWLDWYGARH